MSGARTPPAGGRAIHIDQPAAESGQADVQRLEVTGNKGGKSLTVVCVSDAAAEVEAESGQCVRGVPLSQADALPSLREDLKRLNAYHQLFKKR